MNMLSLRALTVIATLAMTMSEGSFVYKEEGLSTGQQFAEDVQTVAHDLQESVLLKKKAVVGAIGAVGKAKVGVVKDTKEVTGQAVQNVIGAKLTKVEAVEAAKRAFLNTLTDKFNSPGQRHVINNEPLSHEGFLSKLHSFLHAVLPENEQNSFFNFIRKTFSQLPSFSRKQPASNGHIQIGDTEYVFVPVKQGPMTSGQDHEDGNVKFAEAPIQILEPVLYTSTPISSLPPAPTLPPLLYKTVPRSNNVKRRF